ncbi:hypothetical protein M5K25_027991 [Dendrobium thyrsiflorum]|uniref:Uncharacterized protein n=1 Tax=Dendrobium thyrsiflorum TaxID=117978 RepID=A0ABD0TV77_DENTH
MSSGSIPAESKHLQVEAVTTCFAKLYEPKVLVEWTSQYSFIRRCGLDPLHLDNGIRWNLKYSHHIAHPFQFVGISSLNDHPHNDLLAPFVEDSPSLVQGRVQM